MQEMLFDFFFLTVSSAGIYWLAIRYPTTKPSTLFNRQEHQSVRRWIFLTIRTFFMLSLMAYTMFMVFSHVSIWIMAVISVAFLSLIVWDLFREIATTQLNNQRFMQIARLVTPAAAISFSAFWLIHPSWITYDLIALVCGYAVLRTIRPTSAYLVTSILVGVVLYDIWGVYGNMTNNEPSGVIVQLAMHMPMIMPNIVMIPDINHLLSPMSQSMLGLGDIILPGLAIMTAASMGKLNQAYFGYLAGLAGVLILAYGTQMPVPATITLIPGTLFPVLFFRKPVTT